MAFMILALADALPASVCNCATSELIFVEASAGSSAHIHFITVGLPVTYYETIFITYFCARFWQSEYKREARNQRLPLCFAIKPRRGWLKTIQIF